MGHLGPSEPPHGGHLGISHVGMCHMGISRVGMWAQDGEFTTAIADLKKQQELLGHHQKGSQQAKGRFEAMLMNPSG